jgi:hypothetical protein
MKNMPVEDPINPKLAPVCAWFSGAYFIVSIWKDNVVVFTLALVFGGLAYLAYRWRKYSPTT